MKKILLQKEGILDEQYKNNRFFAKIFKNEFLFIRYEMYTINAVPDIDNNKHKGIENIFKLTFWVIVGTSIPINKQANKKSKYVNPNTIILFEEIP